MTKPLIIYNLKFVSGTITIGSQKESSYNLALKEAEGWVLSGKNYSCTIEWETFTGLKSVALDYRTVQKQRKARTKYQQSVKKNLFKNTYVAI